MDTHMNRFDTNKKVSLTFIGTAVLAILLAVFSTASAKAEDTMTFDTLKGKWTGFGWFYFGIDQKERGRCEAVISAEQGPKKGKIDLLCKSEALTIDATAFDIVLDGSDLKGEWTMRSHEVDGSLSGTMSADTFSAKMIPVGQTDDGFGAQLTTKLKDKCNANIDINVDSPVDLKKIEVDVRRC